MRDCGAGVRDRLGDDTDANADADDVGWKRGHGCGVCRAMHHRKPMTCFDLS